MEDLFRAPIPVYFDFAREELSWWCRVLGKLRLEHQIEVKDQYQQAREMIIARFGDYDLRLVEAPPKLEDNHKYTAWKESEARTDRERE